MTAANSDDLSAEESRMLIAGIHKAADWINIGNSYLAESWTPEYAVERITAAYGRSVAAIIETGRELLEAKAKVQHGHWMAVAGRLPFSERTAQYLMDIASSAALANTHHGAYLPSSWRTLAILAQLPSPVVEVGIANGTITPDLERWQAEEIVSRWRETTIIPNSEPTLFGDEEGDEEGEDEPEPEPEPTPDPTPEPEPDPPNPGDPWTAEEEGLKAQFLLTGRSIVVSMRRDGQPRLWEWAKVNGHAVRIDRATDWGNRFETPGDGTRDEVIANFKDHFLPYKPSLRRRYPELRGKIFGCWCYPSPCHGDALIQAVYE